MPPLYPSGPLPEKVRLAGRLVVLDRGALQNVEGEVAAAILAGGLLLAVDGEPLMGELVREQLYGSELWEVEMEVTLRRRLASGQVRGTLNTCLHHGLASPELFPWRFDHAAQRWVCDEESDEEGADMSGLPRELLDRKGE